MDETIETTKNAAAPDSAAETVAEKEPTAQKGIIRRFFTARRISYIATFTALSFALRFLQFAILPMVNFLKFDFSDAVILICAYAMGPASGLLAGVMKEVIYGIFFTENAFVGELANIIILIPFVLIPSCIYRKHKGIKSVGIWLFVSCIIRTAWSFPVNLLLNFPAFLGFNWQLGMSFFLSVWYWVMLFNLIKSVMLAVVVLLLYKSVSRFIRLINQKLDDAKRDRARKTA